MRCAASTACRCLSCTISMSRAFAILGTLQRDTRRYTFDNEIEVVDLGLRLEDIERLEREPAAASKIDKRTLRKQLAQNGAASGNRISP